MRLRIWPTDRKTSSLQHGSAEHHLPVELAWSRLRPGRKAETQCETGLMEEAIRPVCLWAAETSPPLQGAENVKPGEAEAGGDPGDFSSSPLNRSCLGSHCPHPW